VRIVWRGPLTDPSGFASQGRAFVRGLVEEGADLRVEHLVWHWREAITPAERERLADLIDRPRLPADVHLQHTLARIFDPYAAGRVRVGRTAWEVDRVPADWARRAAQMDEVWVPSTHNLRAFAASGVDEDRLWVLPEPLELARYADPVPREVPGAHGTVYLAAFDWTLRKGWDVLIDAWLRAFDDGDDVTLVLKTWSAAGRPMAELEGELLARVAALGGDPARMADVVLLGDLLDDRAMAGLYAACDVFVSPSRGEGFCRPVAEAMAAGRPVIATAHSGPADHVDDAVGWPLPWTPVAVSPEAREESRYPAGATWAEPDAEALAAALRDACARPAERAARGAAARERAARFDHRRIARLALARLAAVEPRDRARAVRTVRDDLPSVLVAGSVFGAHSLAGVNRELARALVRTGGLELGLLDTEGTGLDPAEPGLAPLAPLVDGVLPRVDVTVRHAYPPAFDGGAPGRVVQFLHWEYGPVPRHWVQAQRDDLDEVWAATRWVADWMVRSGMDPDRVAVVPLGVDPGRFRPGLEPLRLDWTPTGYRFLFVGGLLWRKGVDLLLDAYRRAFTRADDVALVVKDFGPGGPYVPQDVQERLRRMAADPAGPAVVHASGTLPEADLPRLYAACDCLVHPYRGEGYGLTVVEAMACGLPVIVPDRGATADFAVPGTAVLVPAADATMATGEIGGMPLADRPRLVEVDADDLAAAMRRAYEDPAGHRALGAAAAAHVRAHHTWDRSAAAALARVRALAGS
jgi:glycosyltransferase involved in cell wall biosynthesis